MPTGENGHLFFPSLMVRLWSFLYLLVLLQPVWSEQEAEKAALPKSIVPRGYQIFLEPDLADLSITGTEQIEIEVREPTAQIVLNSVQTEIANATLEHNTLRETLSPSFQPQDQQVIFETRAPLPPGIYRLSLTFKSRLQQQASGLLFWKYNVGPIERVLLATHLETTGARRVFPCWDDPAFRATYQINLLTERDNQAISNMPIKVEQRFGPKKIVSFQPTPAMASYLIALFCGRFDCSEENVAGVQVRLFAVEGKKDFAQYAGETWRQILPFYNDYFGIRYPLSKLDEIALPDGIPGSSGWGAIAEGQNRVLFDPAQDPASAQREIFRTAAQGLAHQWFGNLVSIGWWNALWLDDGFASFMAAEAAERFHPEWKPWLTVEERKQVAMEADARKTTQPIERSANDLNAAAAVDADDQLTRDKTQQILRMVEKYLGEGPFREGIRAFLRSRKFSTATPADLWESLDQVTGRPIKEMASLWVQQPGFPLVKITAQPVGGERVVTLEQAQFTLDTEDSTTAVWPLPVGIVTTSGSNAKYAVLEKVSGNFQLPSGGGAVKGNAGGVGFFRVWYEPALYTELLNRLGQLSEADRLNLAGDSAAMLFSLRSPASSYFELIDKLRDDTSFPVWQEILRSLDQLDRLEQGQPKREAFQSYVSRLLEPSLQRLGWSEKSGELDDDRQLRPLLIKTLGFFGNRTVIDEAFRRFQDFQKRADAIPPDLRPAILRIVGRYSSASLYEQLLQSARDANSVVRKQMYYEALEMALDPQLAERTLDIALRGEMPPSVATDAFKNMATDGEHVDLVWVYAKTHLAKLLATRSSPERNHFLSEIAANFSDEEHAGELLELVSKSGSADAIETAEDCVNLIRAKSEARAKQLPAVDAWIIAAQGRGSARSADGIVCTR